MNIILLLPTFFFPWVNVFNYHRESIPLRHKKENDTQVIGINVPESSQKFPKNKGIVKPQCLINEILQWGPLLVKDLLLPLCQVHFLKTFKFPQNTWLIYMMLKSHPPTSHFFS